MLYQRKPQRNSYKADPSVLSLIFFPCIYISLGKNILEALSPTPFALTILPILYIST